jgi:hypothetical protein
VFLLLRVKMANSTRHHLLATKAYIRLLPFPPPRWQSLSVHVWNFI